MYILLSGSPPFDGETDDEIISSIRAGKYSLEGGIWPHISPEGKSLLQRLLTVNYTDRPFAKDALTDDWFKNAP